MTTTQADKQMDIGREIERERVRQPREQRPADLHLPAEWLHTGDRIDAFNQQEPRRV